MHSLRTHTHTLSDTHTHTHSLSLSNTHSLSRTLSCASRGDQGGGVRRRTPRRRWSSNPSGKCSQERLTRGTVIARCAGLHTLFNVQGAVLALVVRQLNTNLLFAEVTKEQASAAARLSGIGIAAPLPSEAHNLHPQPSSPNPQPSTLNLQPSTLNPPSTLDPQPSTLTPQPSTLDPQPSTLNPHSQPSTLNPQPSTLNPQP